MNRKIFLFSRDPGGANTIIPLVKPLEMKGYKVLLFGKDFALEKYSKYELKFNNIMDFIKKNEIKTIERLLMEVRPEFIITGTSADDFTEKFIWHCAQKLQIPSFAILDQWANYGIRFSDYNIFELDRYKDNKVHPYLPLKVLVMDQLAKSEAISDGLPADLIEITGHPYFETILNKSNQISSDHINILRKKFSANKNDILITFVSEPISATYNETDNSNHYWGYTERTIFKELLYCLQDDGVSNNKRIIIIIRLHPKEAIDNYKDIVEKFDCEAIKIFIDKDSDAHELVMASNFICGMSSILLIESIILGKPVLSMLIGLKFENPFLFGRIGLLKSVFNKTELCEQLREILAGTYCSVNKFDLIRNPVENVINLMEKYICQA